MTLESINKEIFKFGFFLRKHSLLISDDTFGVKMFHIKSKQNKNETIGRNQNIKTHSKYTQFLLSFSTTKIDITRFSNLREVVQTNWFTRSELV